MNILILALFFIVIFSFVVRLYILSAKRNRNLSIYKWMEMSKYKRGKLDQDQKVNILERKRRLINKTRGEYILYTKKIKK